MTIICILDYDKERLIMAEYLYGHVFFQDRFAGLLRQEPGGRKSRDSNSAAGAAIFSLTFADSAITFGIISISATLSKK